jgi:hypothetical protein
MGPLLLGAHRVFETIEAGTFTPLGDRLGRDGIIHELLENAGDLMSRVLRDALENQRASGITYSTPLAMREGVVEPEHLPSGIVLFPVELLEMAS